MTTPPIVCDALGHEYAGGVLALKPTTLTIQPGEVLGVVGQNGSGKTTLVKHFNGLLRPTSGRLLINGEDARPRPVHDLARHVGYVFQNPNHQLFATTVEAELRFGPTNLGLTPETVAERVQQATSFFGIEKLLTSHPYRLAFPLRKLVAMASVYAMGPDVFVLDEPTTGQDHAGSNMVRKLIERLREQGKTVVIVSHDMALIAEVADRVLALWAAEVIASGSPRAIFAEDRVMQRTKLYPPQITQFARRWAPASTRPLPLTVAEAAAAVLGEER
ncbi:MAG: ATP-binding cassette domain-containing protein [Anaerolineales bacterium]|nr:ATP-binding cassette domain-containing protein [Anaerolineales bacterium]